jgi:hypothetical protein
VERLLQFHPTTELECLFQLLAVTTITVRDGSHTDADNSWRALSAPAGSASVTPARDHGAMHGRQRRGTDLLTGLEACESGRIRPVSRINLRTTVAYHTTKDIGQTSALLNPALHRSRASLPGQAASVLAPLRAAPPAASCPS